MGEAYSAHELMRSEHKILAGKSEGNRPPEGQATFDSSTTKYILIMRSKLVYNEVEDFLLKRILYIAVQ
jgi:hypothetical protein